jgi:SAM-dependent methyltransferase
MEKEWNLLEQTLVLLLMKMYRLCKGITSSIPHMAKYKSWLEARMNQFKDGGHSIVSQTQDWMRLDPDQQESILTSLTKELKESGTGISFFASFAQRVSENVVSMFEGKTSSLEILMEDNGLEQFYDQMVYPEDYKSFLSTMCHSRANLRILEIGAGTGSMTAAALESLTAPEGGKMFSQYVFTDISPGFLTAAKDRFKQIDGLVFQVLDISKDPVDQDFGLACFDLIICSNVLHATPSLKQSLTHVRKLLSPGGYLFLQETCPELIFADAIMGLLPGWWIGEGDQRASKPHVTPERWHQELSAAGFTGIEAVSHDNIWPYHFNANIISRITDTLVSEKHVSLLHTVVRSDSCLLFEKMLLSAGYTVAWFTLNGISTVQSPGHVISLLDLDAPFFAEMNEEEFLSFRQFISQTSPKSILWITRHIQLECKDPRWSHVLGLGRTLRLELSLPFATVEMDFLDQKLTSSFLNVFESFQSSINSGSEPDYEYSIQGERVYTSRYYPTLLDLSQDGEVIEPNMTPKRLTIGTSGLLDSLHWIPTERIAPGVGEVEVEIRYVGLNFRVSGVFLSVTLKWSILPL